MQSSMQYTIYNINAKPNSLTECVIPNRVRLSQLSNQNLGIRVTSLFNLVANVIFVILLLHFMVNFQVARQS